MFGLIWVVAALADPCGMVPPIYTGPGPEPVGIERTGLQQTYVFFEDGVETLAIRPAFSGSVEEFGMLIPIPAVPALRKIDDRTFDHLAAALDPPKVLVHVVPERPVYAEKQRYVPSAAASSMEMSRDEVRVVKEEAVGMYEVAVLEAGSAKALDRWMSQHDFRYPKGMDQVVGEYVAEGWLFVAVKTKVSGASDVAPAPGKRGVRTGLPPGGSFDGFVQGMAFRFRVEAPVVPMRLSTFNGGDTHNRVYIVAPEPSMLEGISREFVRRQLDGAQLYDHLTEPLKVVYQGERSLLRRRDNPQVESQRDPTPYNGVAKHLLAADLLAVTRQELSLPFEETEKELLRISEALNLRGAEIDVLHTAALSELREQALAPAMSSIQEVSLTVVDGNFSADTLRRQNLSVTPYRVPASRNKPVVWHLEPPGPEVWLYY